MHAFDRQMDGRTVGQTDGESFLLTIDRAAMQRGSAVTIKLTKLNSRCMKFISNT